MKSTLICIGTDEWQQQAPSRPWTHVTVRAGFQIGGLPVTQPSEIFTSLEMHLTGITRVGSESVDGAATTQYRGTESSAPSGSSQPVETVVEVWIDADDMIRQLTSAEHLTVTSSPSDSTGETFPPATSTVAVTARFSDFGVHTDIQPPLANQVIEGGTAP